MMKRTSEKSDDVNLGVATTEAISPGYSKRMCPEKSNDYFEEHFCSHICENLFVQQLQSGLLEEKKALKFPSLKNSVSYAIWRNSCEVSFTGDGGLTFTEFGIKSKLLKNFKNLKNVEDGHAIADELYQIVGRYMDLCFVSKKDHTALICLHSLNHIVRTRQLIIRNNHTLEAMRESLSDEVIEQCRDQGLARPKILILCPFKKYAYDIVKTMIKLIFTENEKSFVSNLAKFEDEFGDDGNRIHERKDVPNEYKELMSGNVGDCFRIGIGLAKKCLKLYTSFDECDILLCSPLGLRMIIGDETEEKREHDFLAAIEVLIVDKAHLLFMQNWEHLINIFQTINSSPAKITTDISRVRQWALNDFAKFYRQTLIFSEVNTVEIQALFSRFCRNFAGQLSIVKSRKSTIETIEIPIVQGFYKFGFGNPEKQSDDRFNFFVKEILPYCERQTLIFVSSYYDFVRLRNHLKKENESFAQIQEYANKGKIAKARNLFFLGQKKLLLLTERFHFYFRAKIKGVRSVVFYQLPVNPQFYGEIINNSCPDEKLSSKVLYCEYDVIRLQNIFGNTVARNLIRSEKKFCALIGE